MSLRDALRDAGELGFGPKVTGVDPRAERAARRRDRDVRRRRRPATSCSTLLDKTGYLKGAARHGDAQDEARAENLEELVAQTKEFRRNTPDGTLIDFLTGVALFAAADEIDDDDGSVSIMTLHTAKGLEYDTVFLTGVEEDLLPHRMSSGEPGGLAEERRLFYVGITRAKKRLFLSLAMTRSMFGDTQRRDAEPVPAGDPGRAHRLAAVARRRDLAAAGCGRARSTPRAARSSGSRTQKFSYSTVAPADAARRRPSGRAPVTNKVRDNGDLTLAVGRPHPSRRLRRGSRHRRHRRRAEEHRRGAVRHRRPQAPADQDRADREALAADAPRLRAAIRLRPDRRARCRHGAR